MNDRPRFSFWSYTVGGAPVMLPPTETERSRFALVPNDLVAVDGSDLKVCSTWAEAMKLERDGTV